MDPGAERSTACEILATSVTILTTVETKELTITYTAWPKKKKCRHLKKKGHTLPLIMLQRTLQRCVAPRPAPGHTELFHCQQVFFKERRRERLIYLGRRTGESQPLVEKKGKGKKKIYTVTWNYFSFEQGFQYRWKSRHRSALVSKLRPWKKTWPASPINCYECGGHSTISFDHKKKNKSNNNKLCFTNNNLRLSGCAAAVLSLSLSRGFARTLTHCCTIQTRIWWQRDGIWKIGVRNKCFFFLGSRITTQCM